MGKTLVAIGGVLIALGALVMFVVGPLLTSPSPAAEGANIGAGLFALFSLVLLVAGLVVAAIGTAVWVATNRRNRV